MGLAEPRKRLKISHDPNNLTWAKSAESYGQKLLTSQGWKPGQGLGAKGAKHFNSPGAPKIKISYKDDNLGLGASLKSHDPEHSRTGLDAFQGLLGRLNGKSEAQLEKEAHKIEDRKLAIWAQGRWGGVTFVPGGLLAQGDGYRKITTDEDMTPSREDSLAEIEQSSAGTGIDSENECKRSLKREERREKKRKGAPAVPQSGPETTQRFHKSGSTETESGPEYSASREEDFEKPPGSRSVLKQQRGMKQSDSEVSAKAQTSVLPRNGRHIIRSRNIHAKRMASSDAKMLDEIFMRKIQS